MIKALIFDQDGVIIDTEKDGHRVSFNRTFEEFGYDVRWSVEEYGELLRIGGGKERMTHYLHTRGFGVPVPAEAEADLIRRLHERKTELFIELIESGALPLRPGVKRIMKEAMDRGLTLGVCTTSNERAARAIACGILKDITFDFVLAGDIVSKKKPDPEIYLLALERTRLKPQECIVVEDSGNGVAAAMKAGMHVVATTTGYTEDEELSGADIIVSCLGDPDGEMGVMRKGPGDMSFDGVLKLDQLIEYFSKR